jgi:hypothetical protein
LAVGLVVAWFREDSRPPHVWKGHVPDPLLLLLIVSGLDAPDGRMPSFRRV